MSAGQNHRPDRTSSDFQIARECVNSSARALGGNVIRKDNHKLLGRLAALDPLQRGRLSV